MHAQNRSPVAPRNPFLAILGLSLGLPLLMLVVLLLAVTSYLRLGRDARALRNALAMAAPVPCSRTIEVNVGNFTLDLARFGLHWVNLEPRVRELLPVARGAEVGVYRLQGDVTPSNRVAMLAAADDAMARRGWERLAGVVHCADMVTVYVPADISSPRDVRVCVAVLGKRDLVVASARGDLEPLMQLAMAEVAKLQPPLRNPGN